METRITLHIVDGDMRSRAEQARTAFALGHHAEVYDDLDELLARPPQRGVLLLRQRSVDETLADLLDRLGDSGIWLPVIVCASELLLERVVSALKHGALDYLQLPLEANRLAQSLTTVMREARAHSAARQRLTYAREKIATLSRREREVLEWLAEGSSNKQIARELEISPRTVEIHRSNMMTKLGANHAAEAVRLWLEARLDHVISVPDLVEQETWLDALGERDRGETTHPARRSRPV
ncbi:response regulator transcription factor [Croceibacterium aestuarii]|uniref:response regulator transcription factor n=1 Tax=Croceibacterium aestuarii TaxID=3064139 RepID=UPI00272DEA99|nr:LuxR C-terminal-related transcriptional regulator [Croceibacterium sp. D39]